MENQMKDKLKLETTVTLKLNLLQKRVDQMYWDWQKLSTAGQETLDEIADLVGLKQLNQEERDAIENESWKID